MSGENAEVCLMNAQYLQLSSPGLTERSSIPRHQLWNREVTALQNGLLRGACHRAALRADPLARNDDVTTSSFRPPSRDPQSAAVVLGTRLVVLSFST
jgi:hypothetical protein